MTHDDLAALLARLKKMLADYHALPERQRMHVDLHWRLADEFRTHGSTLIEAAEAGLAAEADTTRLRAAVLAASAAIRHAVSDIGMLRPDAAVRELETWLEQQHEAAVGLDSAAAFEHAFHLTNAVNAAHREARALGLRPHSKWVIEGDPGTLVLEYLGDAAVSSENVIQAEHKIYAAAIAGGDCKLLSIVVRRDEAQMEQLKRHCERSGMRFWSEPIKPIESPAPPSEEGEGS